LTYQWKRLKLRKLNASPNAVGVRVYLRLLAEAGEDPKKVRRYYVD